MKSEVAVLTEWKLLRVGQMLQIISQEVTEGNRKEDEEAICPIC